jgi:hypothetical protein
MFADLPNMLQLAFGMVAIFDGLLALVLLLSFAYLGYYKWLKRFGRPVVGMITNVTPEKQAKKRGLQYVRYEVSWTDPRTQQVRHTIKKYPTTIQLNRTWGDTVPVYVHPIFSWLRAVRLVEDSSLLWRAWREGELGSYLAGVFFRAVWVGGVGAALCFIPALAIFLQFSLDWQKGLGILLGGFLTGFIGAWIGGIFIRR